MNLPRFLACAVMLILTGCSSVDSFWGDAETSATPDSAIAAPVDSQPETPFLDTLWGSAQPDDTSAQDAPAAANRPSTAPAASGGTVPGVEIVWEVPLKPVEFYHIYYGTAPEATSRHIKVPVEELTKTDDPKYGPVFKYQLLGVPEQSEVYVVLRAENRAGLSDPTPPMKLR